MLPWARTAYAAALRTNAKKQVAEQAQAAGNIARPEVKARAAKSAKPAKKQPAQKARAAKPAGKKTANQKTARPAKAVKRGKRK
jgi:hypothetical protein